MKHNRNPLAKAINYALGAGMIASLAMTAAPVAAQDDDEEEAADLDRFQVTGSRIKRSDVEGAVPVTVIDRETIELSGKTSVADLLRETSFNSAGSFRPQSGSSAQSFAGLSLRALGSGRTLILVDGRRAPIAPNVGSAQDLNSIPLAMVERVEILSDGASAIYGTDAIGGVVNIITRKDFNGAEITFQTSEPEREGGDTQAGSAIVGISGDRGQIVAGVSYNERDIVFARDRPWSAGGLSVFSNNFLTADSFFLEHPTYGSANVPGCQGEGFQTTEPGPGRRCFYDYTLVSADEAAIRNEALFTRSTFEINRDWSMYLNAQVTRPTSFGRYAPVPSSPWLVGPGSFPYLPAGSPNHPATPPSEGGLNPNWEDYQQFADQDLQFLHRFAANGPRDTTTDAQLYDVDLGFQGRVGNWDLEFGGRRTESQYTEVGRNYIVSALAQPQFDSGAYNIYDPFNVSQDVLESFTATIGRDANYTAEEYFATASTDLFDMAAGPVGFAIGAEYRDEEYKDIYDALQQAGNITGSAGNSAAGGRDSKAFFVEALFPLLDTLEMTVAARYDDYSDFGSATSPKVAFRFQPFDALTLRASYGQGFNAPSLDILSARPSFSADSVVDEQTCVAFGLDPGCETQITAFVISNSNLDAEESDQYSLGAAFEPTDWFSGTLDFWQIEIENQIDAISSQQIINCIAGTSQNCPPGLSVLDPNADVPDESLGLGIARREGTGAIAYVQRGFTNLGTIETSGADLNLRTNFDFGGMGSLQNELQATYTAEFETAAGDDVAGDAGLPEWRATLRNQWSVGDFVFAWNINYIDGQDDSFGNIGPLSSWTTHDIQATWYAPWNAEVTLGARNLADKDPVLDPGDPSGRGFNFSLYDGYGRVPYVRYKQTF